MSAQSVSLSITGMHCGGCVRRVTAALTAVEGVADLKVDVGTATFTVDDDDDVAAAVGAIAGIGFAVADQTVTATS